MRSLTHLIRPERISQSFRSFSIYTVVSKVESMKCLETSHTLIKWSQSESSISLDSLWAHELKLSLLHHPLDWTIDREYVSSSKVKEVDRMVLESIISLCSLWAHPPNSSLLYHLDASSLIWDRELSRNIKVLQEKKPRLWWISSTHHAKKLPVGLRCMSWTSEITIVSDTLVTMKNSTNWATVRVLISLRSSSKQRAQSLKSSILHSHALASCQWHENYMFLVSYALYVPRFWWFNGILEEPTCIFNLLYWRPTHSVRSTRFCSKCKFR